MSNVPWPKLILNSLMVKQESWDLARKLSCPTSSINDKTVFFKPIEVDMLEVVSVPAGSTGTIDCWMDIQRGTYPQVKLKKLDTLDRSDQYHILVRFTHRQRSRAHFRKQFSQSMIANDFQIFSTIKYARDLIFNLSL